MHFMPLLKTKLIEKPESFQPAYQTCCIGLVLARTFGLFESLFISKCQLFISALQYTF